ncbi:hypothetical protein [Roseicella aerolata]|uniref:Uncharacterized protein n=1 Tax=Roseicella aerolata TaxID=2883479 RepID=A0A9X1II88_9PROT|nr:hypothetical protein [Roseicella aerolata]MCB4825132.1 hypothetical protein [Roseicella aerolata]
MADNLAAGRRETPQRFIPVARHAAEDGRRRLALVRLLLSDALTEACEEGEYSATALALLARVAAAVGSEGDEVDVTALRGLEGDVLALAPRIGRRRSIHCHGRIAADRRLLLARAVLDDAKAWGRDGAAWYTLWLAISYAVSDYERDHFVTLGPRVERRVRRLAAWCGAARAALARPPGGPKTLAGPS